MSYSAIRFIRLQKRGEKETPPETGLSIRNRSFIDTLYARCTPKRWPEKTKCLESATYVEPKYWLPSPPEVENRPPSDDVKRSFEPTAIAGRTLRSPSSRTRTETERSSLTKAVRRSFMNAVEVSATSRKGKNVTFR